MEGRGCTHMRIEIVHIVLLWSCYNIFNANYSAAVMIFVARTSAIQNNSCAGAFTNAHAQDEIVISDEDSKDDAPARSDELDGEEEDPLKEDADEEAGLKKRGECSLGVEWMDATFGQGD
jgi:hypothetical protein